MRTIITGAASGIGEATALLLAQSPPAELLLVDRDRDGLRNAADAASRAGASVSMMVADLADPAAPALIVEAADARMGGLDAVVSNAGAIHGMAIRDVGAAEFDRLMAINARAALLLGQAAYPLLKRSRGALIATASVAAEHPTVPTGAYAASKAALVMLVKQMALEWGPDGIRCNCVSPGPTLTAMTAAGYGEEEKRTRRAQDIPLRRIGLPQDLANAIQFLLGPAASFITGVNLVVDGGLSTTLMISSNSAAQTIGTR